MFGWDSILLFCREFLWSIFAGRSRWWTPQKRRDIISTLIYNNYFNIFDNLWTVIPSPFTIASCRTSARNSPASRVTWDMSAGRVVCRLRSSLGTKLCAKLGWFGMNWLSHLIVNLNLNHQKCGWQALSIVDLCQAESTRNLGEETIIQIVRTIMWLPFKNKPYQGQISPTLFFAWHFCHNFRSWNRWQTWDRMLGNKL